MPTAAAALAGPMSRRRSDSRPRLRRRDRHIRSRPRRSGATAVVQGDRARRLRLLARRAGHLPRAVGPASRPRRRRAVVRGAGRDRGPAAAADVAGAAADRRAARGGSGLRLLPLRREGRRPDRAAARTGRSGRASPSRASAGTGGCAWPTSSGPRESGETDVVAFQLVTIGPKISEATGELFAKQRLPRLPGAARAVRAAGRGAGGVLAHAGPGGARASARPTRLTSMTSSGSGTGAAGTRSATRPALTWRTGPR